MNVSTRSFDERPAGLTRNSWRHAALVGLLSVVWAAEGMSAPKSYVMMCRGGGQMTYELSPRSDSQVITIRFSKGRQAAGSAPIPAGHCIWTDRGIRADEPAMIVVKLPGAYIDAVIGADGRLVKVRARAQRSAGDKGRKTAQRLNYLLDAIRNNRPFQVRAYQYTSGSRKAFAVTQIGP